MQSTIGIRKENIDVSEKRAPLTPKHVEKLIRTDGVNVIVEPAKNRIFKNEDYVRAGASISNDLTKCNIVFGVKEIPISDIVPKMTYCVFSHTIKGQSQNMPILKQMLHLRNTLLDYEKVTDINGKRLIFFGRYAGYAGMIDSLWALGKRLNWEGIRTPLSRVKYATEYESLQQAIEAIKEIGKIIEDKGFSNSITPFICGFAGYGQVSQGAQTIYDLLPTKAVYPSQLGMLVKKGNYSNKIAYKVVFEESHLVRPKSKISGFELTDYFTHPEKYVNNFHVYLPFLTLLINGIYWEPKYPRLVSINYLKENFSKNILRKLKVIGDISCDLKGSIECTVKTTNSENPIYLYNPNRQNISDGFEGEGIVILAVDKLPAELPEESSNSFGKTLLPFVPSLAKTDFQSDLPTLNIPKEFKNSIITHKGFLSPKYKYLKQYLG